MPTYVYRCEHCGHRFEAWQHMTDDPLTTCPQCEGPIHRVLFPAGIVFKGSGFYSTDHGRTAAATDAGAPKEGAKPETAGGDGQSGASKPSEAKPGESKPGETKSAAPSSAAAE